MNPHASLVISPFLKGWTQEGEHAMPLDVLVLSFLKKIFIFLFPQILFLKNFYWSIVDLQCCVSFSKVIQLYIYIYVYVLFQILYPYRLSQNIE